MGCRHVGPRSSVLIQHSPEQYNLNCLFSVESNVYSLDSTENHKSSLFFISSLDWILAVSWRRWWYTLEWIIFSESVWSKTNVAAKLQGTGLHQVKEHHQSQMLSLCIIAAKLAASFSCKWTIWPSYNYLLYFIFFQCNGLPLESDLHP